MLLFPELFVPNSPVICAKRIFLMHDHDLKLVRLSSVSTGNLRFYSSRWRRLAKQSRHSPLVHDEALLARAPLAAPGSPAGPVEAPRHLPPGTEANTISSRTQTGNWGTPTRVECQRRYPWEYPALCQSVVVAVRARTPRARPLASRFRVPGLPKSFACFASPQPRRR